jgi:hypothetical protein
MTPTVYVDPAVAAVRTLYGSLLSTAERARPIRDQLAAQAACLARAHAAGAAAVEFQIASWHPRWVGQRALAILAGVFDEADARLTIAREHGYGNWAHVDAEGAGQLDSMFEAAVDTALAGDVAGLRALLREAPDLVARRSRFAHGASLLHYMASNGVETWRQATPTNAAVIVDVLIEAGADVNAEAPIYGGARALGLVASSAHPKAAGVADAIVATLRAAGAH